MAGINIYINEVGVFFDFFCVYFVLVFWFGWGMVCFFGIGCVGCGGYLWLFVVWVGEEGIVWSGGSLGVWWRLE